MSSNGNDEKGSWFSNLFKPNSNSKPPVLQILEKEKTGNNLVDVSSQVSAIQAQFKHLESKLKEKVDFTVLVQDVDNFIQTISSANHLISEITGVIANEKAQNIDTTTLDDFVKEYQRGDHIPIAAQYLQRLLSEQENLENTNDVNVRALSVDITELAQSVALIGRLGVMMNKIANSSGDTLFDTYVQDKVLPKFQQLEKKTTEESKDDDVPLEKHFDFQFDEQAHIIDADDVSNLKSNVVIINDFVKDAKKLETLKTKNNKIYVQLVKLQSCLNMRVHAPQSLQQAPGKSDASANMQKLMAQVKATVSTDSGSLAESKTDTSIESVEDGHKKNDVNPHQTLLEMYWKELQAICTEESSKDDEDERSEEQDSYKNAEKLIEKLEKIEALKKQIHAMRDFLFPEGVAINETVNDTWQAFETFESALDDKKGDNLSDIWLHLEPLVEDAKHQYENVNSSTVDHLKGLEKSEALFLHILSLKSVMGMLMANISEDILSKEAKRAVTAFTEDEAFVIDSSMSTDEKKKSTGRVKVSKEVTNLLTAVEKVIEFVNDLQALKTLKRSGVDVFKELVSLKELLLGKLSPNARRVRMNTGASKRQGGLAKSLVQRHLQLQPVLSSSVKPSRVGGELKDDGPAVEYTPLPKLPLKKQGAQSWDEGVLKSIRDAKNQSKPEAGDSHTENTSSRVPLKPVSRPKKKEEQRALTELEQEFLKRKNNKKANEESTKTSASEVLKEKPEEKLDDANPSFSSCGTPVLHHAPNRSRALSFASGETDNTTPDTQSSPQQRARSRSVGGVSGDKTKLLKFKPR